MKKLTILALIILFPAVAMAAEPSFEGDPAFFVGVPGGTVYVYAGEVYELTPGPTNAGFISSCDAIDTFCVHAVDTAGWTVLSEGLEDPDCWDLDAGYWIPDWIVSVTVPCEALIGDLNVVTMTMAYCDADLACRPDAGDCEDPNVYNDVPRYQVLSQLFEVVEAPPALYVLQDTLFLVEQGVVAAYIPFSICNGDPCAAPTDYNYAITGQGTIGGTTLWTGTAVGVPGGECLDVFAEVDASLAEVCDYDTLTIIAWSLDGSVYDTCVQAIHIIEPVPVPLFTAPVVTILVLAMILAAAVIMKRHAVSKA